jgi:tripartite-type tricarboxylate transporter receptor subunit TctC
VPCTNAVSAAVDPTLPYDPVKSFAAVSLIGNSPYVLTTNTKLPANNVTELVALAKAKPGEIRNGTFGTESLAYLAGAWFSSLADVTFNQITYRSSSAHQRAANTRTCGTPRRPLAPGWFSATNR